MNRQELDVKLEKPSTQTVTTHLRAIQSVCVALRDLTSSLTAGFGRLAQNSRRRVSAPTLCELGEIWQDRVTIARNELAQLSRNYHAISGYEPDHRTLRGRSVCCSWHDGKRSYQA